MTARLLTDLSMRAAVALFDALCEQEALELHVRDCRTVACLACETLRSNAHVKREKAFAVACTPLPDRASVRAS